MTILIHGFWGQPQDWNPVLAQLPLEHEVLIPDLYGTEALSPRHELKNWVQNFIAWLDHFAGNAPVELVGYSMGARLALNAVIAKPERFSRVLLLSSGVLIPAKAMADREQWERGWQEKFRSQPWRELEQTWQDQAVFGGSPQVSDRRRSDDLREGLALSLENWSIRRHPFEWEHVRRLKPGVEWAFGALDQKYLEVAKTLRELPVQGQINIIPNAGHRLISQSFVAEWIKRTH